jgi:hypothetical protein
LWHLQKFLQYIKYITLKFTPCIILLYYSSPYSWSSFNRSRFSIYIYVYTIFVLCSPSYSLSPYSPPSTLAIFDLCYITHCDQMLRWKPLITDVISTPLVITTHPLRLKIQIFPYLPPQMEWRAWVCATLYFLYHYSHYQEIRWLL